MGNSEWIALGALIVAIVGSASGIMLKLADNRNAILARISENKEAIDDELTAMRQASYQEYTELRREIEDTSAKAYREFGESLLAIREKVNQIEIWILNELKDTRHTLTGAIDVRHQMMNDRIEALNDRIRQVEIEQARSGLRQ